MPDSRCIVGDSRAQRNVNRALFTIVAEVLDGEKRREKETRRKSQAFDSQNYLCVSLARYI